jgi:hypothetical protein
MWLTERVSLGSRACSTLLASLPQIKRAESLQFCAAKRSQIPNRPFLRARPEGHSCSDRFRAEGRLKSKASGFRKPIDDLVVNATDLLKPGLLIDLRRSGSRFRSHCFVPPI